MVAPRGPWEGRRSWEQPQLLGQGQGFQVYSETPTVPIFWRSPEFVVMGAVAAPLPSPHPPSPWAGMIPPPVLGPRCLVCSSSCTCHTAPSFILLHLGWHRHQDVQLSGLPLGSRWREHSLMAAGFSQNSLWKDLLEPLLQPMQDLHPGGLLCASCFQTRGSIYYSKNFHPRAFSSCAHSLEVPFPVWI